MEFKGIMKDDKLANMNRAYLEKEARRRGISTSQVCWTDLALKVAYAEGYNIGKSEQSFSYPTKATMPKAETKRNFCLEDEDGEKYFLTLTDSQINLLDWLESKSLLSDSLTYEEVGEIKFEEV